MSWIFEADDSTQRVLFRSGAAGFKSIYGMPQNAYYIGSLSNENA